MILYPFAYSFQVSGWGNDPIDLTKAVLVPSQNYNNGQARCCTVI